MVPWQDKGKAPAHYSISGDKERHREAVRLQRAMEKRSENRQRRAELLKALGEIGVSDDDDDPLESLQAIDATLSSDEEGRADAELGYRSKQDWEDLMRSHEAMSKELANLRDVTEQNNQLLNGNARASGSRPRPRDNASARATPVACGGPALHDLPARSPSPRVQPPPPNNRRPRHFVALPKSKAAVDIKDIQTDAGLRDDIPRWLEISNAIRDLMTRVGMDYDNSWTQQDKSKLGTLYSLILKEAPELGVFQNGWATEWLVQNKFNNHRYYSGKHRKRRYSSVKAEDDEQGRCAAPAPPAETAAQRPASRQPTSQPPPSLAAPAVTTTWQPTPRSPSSRPSPAPELASAHQSLPPSPARDQPQELLQDLPQEQPQGAPPTPAPDDQPYPSTGSASSSRPRKPRSRPSRGNPGTPGTRYNLRVRAAAVTDAEAQTAASIERHNRKAAAGRKSQKGKKDTRKSESPLRALEESDDGGRLSEEEYA